MEEEISVQFPAVFFFCFLSDTHTSPLFNHFHFLPQSQYKVFFLGGKGEGRTKSSSYAQFPADRFFFFFFSVANSFFNRLALDLSRLLMGAVLRALNLSTSQPLPVSTSLPLPTFKTLPVYLPLYLPVCLSTCLSTSLLLSTSFPLIDSHSYCHAFQVFLYRRSSS